tara:strand:- start:1663 stop:1878 length:216 start_codon:yes stop_codon:yes gene_type:complete
MNLYSPDGVCAEGLPYAGLTKDKYTEFFHDLSRVEIEVLTDYCQNRRLNGKGFINITYRGWMYFERRGRSE